MRTCRRRTTSAVAQQSSSWRLVPRVREGRPWESCTSVLGPMDAARLGFTLVHEHVAAASPGILRSWPKLYGGRDRLVGLAVEVLTEAKTNGVDTIVDAT